MIILIKKLFSKINYFLFNKISSKNFKINLEIDINKIQYFLKLKDTLDKSNLIWNGDWDIKKLHISLYRNYSINYNSLFQIYEENKNYKDCDEYKFKENLIKNGKKSERAKTIAELQNYFISLDNLKESLNKFGYLSQKELNSSNHYDEIGVVIGRNGEIIKLEDKFGGTHRFALCKIFKLKKIVVNVKAIHSSLLTKNNILKILNTNDKSYLTEIIKSKI